MGKHRLARAALVAGSGLFVGGAFLGLSAIPSGALSVQVGPYGYAHQTSNGNSVTAFAWSGFAYASAGSGSSGNTGNVAIAIAVGGYASASAGNG